MLASVIWNVIGTIQPAKAQKLLDPNDKKVDDDGFFERFGIMAFPDMPEFIFIDRAPNHQAEQKLTELAFMRLCEANLKNVFASEHNPVVRFSQWGARPF